MRTLSPGAWRLEPKLDGWRAQVWVDDATVTVRTRHGRDITEVLPELSVPPGGVAGRQVLLDGELIVGAGTADDFYRLGPRLARTARTAHLGCTVSFVAFDVLWHDDQRLTHLSYAERRHQLEEFTLDVGSWRTADSLDADPTALLTGCEQLGIEGLVAKRLDGRYRAGRRGQDWIKLKTTTWLTDHAPRRKAA